MKKLLLILLCFPLLFNSCGIPQEDYDKLKQENSNLTTENSNLTTENEKLAGELDECLNGESRLISKVYMYYKNKSYKQTKIWITKLAWDYPNSIKNEEFMLLLKSIDEKIKLEKRKEDEKYPNLVGIWIVNETNYLSTLNSIVRIYKKSGVYYKSMVFDKDGSESVLKLNKDSDIRYEVIGKSDYCLINPDGHLIFSDKQGYILTCIKK
tara:strand:- start:125 stop:754 length:630 start_codon:yes stop_codon:yes gene_type:complete